MPNKKVKEEIDLFYAYLRKNGLKKTYQKDLILETFLNTEGHLSVEDLYTLVKRKDRKVGVVTVFRTLKSLTECGIAREITLGDGLTRFEHSYHHPHHHHIVCTQCHKAIEFVSPDLERIQEEVIQKYRFQPIYHRFQAYGICEDCRKQRPVLESVKHDTEKVFARDALQMAISMETRCLAFYRSAAELNVDEDGKEVLRRVAEEEEEHLAGLKVELQELLESEKGLEQAPIFLHFDATRLEGLLPDLSAYRTADRLKIEAKDSFDLAMVLKKQASGFFRDFADKFVETRGKRVFQRFADAEIKHHDALCQEIACSLPVVI